MGSCVSKALKDIRWRKGKHSFFALEDGIPENREGK